MDVFEEILEIPLDPVRDDYARLASVKKDAATAVTNIAVKVDDNRFRALAADNLNRLLEVIEREERLLSDGRVVVLDN
jgi:hypothetical protein